MKLTNKIRAVIVVLGFIILVQFFQLHTAAPPPKPLPQSDLEAQWNRSRDNERNRVLRWLDTAISQETETGQQHTRHVLNVVRGKVVEGKEEGKKTP